jgi:hypothetical protein
MTGGESGATRVASTITAVSVFIAAVLFIYQINAPISVMLSITAGSTLAIITIIQERNSTLSTGVTTVLLPLSAALGITSIGVAAIESGTLEALLFGGTEQSVEQLTGSLIMYIGVTLGVGIATYGVIMTRRGGPSQDVLIDIWKQTAVIELFLGAIATAVLIFQLNILTETSLPALPLGIIVELLINPSSLSVGLFITGIEATISAVIITETTQAMPITEVASRRRRKRLQTITDRVQTILWQLAFVIIGLTLLSILAVQIGWLAILIRRIPYLALFVEFVMSTGLRIFFVSTICVCGGIITLNYLIQRLSGNVIDTAQWIAPVSIGISVIIFLAFMTSTGIQSAISTLPLVIQPQIAELVQLISPVGVVVIYIEIALSALAVVLVMSIISAVIGYLPSNATGGAIAGTGLVGSTLSIGIFDQAPAIVFSGVALAIIAWDSNRHGVTAQSELGTDGGTRVTILHSINTTTIAVLGIGIAWGLQSTVMRLSASRDGALTGLVVLVPAVLILLTILRG